MMKKHFKKLVNLALTAVMVMGMSTTTFAKNLIISQMIL